MRATLAGANERNKIQDPESIDGKFLSASAGQTGTDD
jgi:hypothetical protein